MGNERKDTTDHRNNYPLIVFVAKYRFEYNFNINHTIPALIAWIRFSIDLIEKLITISSCEQKVFHIFIATILVKIHQYVNKICYLPLYSYPLLRRILLLSEHRSRIRVIIGKSKEQ